MTLRRSPSLSLTFCFFLSLSLSLKDPAIVKRLSKLCNVKGFFYVFLTGQAKATAGNTVCKILDVDMNLNTGGMTAVHGLVVYTRLNLWQYWPWTSWRESIGWSKQ